MLSPGGESSARGTGSSVQSQFAADVRGQLEQRLAMELDDATLAAQVVAGLDDPTVERLATLAGGDIAGSPALSYSPTTVRAGEVGSLWIFSYGYRFAPGASPDGQVPPMEALEPGPVNTELARLAADFVREHPVPIVAQWEVAQVLDRLGVDDVISVEPEFAADGTISYLSTAGVAEKGLRLAKERGITVGHAGVLAFADHAVRCVLTARDAGMTADVPEGVELPHDYDPQSGQEWTLARSTWIPADLYGRSFFAR